MDTLGLGAWLFLFPRGLENNALACIEGSILEGFSQTARNTFLAQLRRMTAQEPGHSSDIDACIEAAPPAPLSPPPPPAPPAMPTSPPPYTAPPHPSSPPQPAEPPPAVPPSPPPPPPPPTSRTPTSLPAEAMKPPAATTPSGYPPAKTAAPKVVVADPPRLGSIASAALESPSGPVREGNTAKLSLDDGGGGGNDAVRPSEIQDEDSQSTGTTTPAPVEVRGMVADVNDVITRALVVAAALVFAFVIVLVIGGAVWYLHATRPEDADGISAAAHGSNNNNVTMQPSPLGILPETPRTDDGFSAQGGSARHIDDTPPRSPVARVVRSALFRHGLPTPRAAEGAAAPDAGPPPADGSLASSQMGGGSNLEPMVLATRASRVSWAGYSRRVLTGQLHGTDHPLSARGASTDRSEKLGYQDSPNMPVPKAQTARFHRSNSCNYDGILQVATAPNFQSGEVPGPCAPAQTSHLPVPPR